MAKDNTGSDAAQTETITDISRFTVTTPGGQRMNGEEFVKFVSEGGDQGAKKRDHVTFGAARANKAAYDAELDALLAQQIAEDDAARRPSY